MTSTLAQTPLHAWHEANGGRLVDFAGWSMPVQYGSIVDEHNATRNSIGLFDVSHMGRFRFDGTGTGAFLDRLLTRRVLDLSPGQIRYSLVTNESGGILDDVLVYLLNDADDTPFHFMVVNASNRDKIASWIRSHLTDADDVAFTDETLETAMIAVQGPRAIDAAKPLLGVNPVSLKNYTGAVADIASNEGIVSRTGYTGEDGVELIVAADAAEAIWNTLIENGGVAAGLGARDTLRLEAAMPLYGHELSEDTNPIQAGLRFAVNLKDRDFVGRDAMLQAKNDPELPVRVGLEMDGRRAAREHYKIVSGDELVGEVTSGTFSPTLQRPIAMGYVRPDVAEIGTELSIDVRGSLLPARVVKLPFYKRT